MTLKEFFEQNGNKPIEIREDGTIRILEEKGPWKPEYGDRYHAYPQRCDKTLIVAKEGSVTAFDIWFETEADCRRAIESLTDDEKAALCWMGENE